MTLRRIRAVAAATCAIAAAAVRALLCVCLALLLVVRASASEENGTPEPTPKPGFFGKVLGIFHHSPKPESVSSHGRKFVVTLDVEPLPLKLSENRQMRVTLVLTNKSSNFVHLEFPTTQRIEILVRNKEGKLVTQWSEDQSFSNEPSYVAINPGERVEYSESVPTREMVAGQPYTVEGFFPNYDDLKTTKTVVPDQ